MTNNFTKTPCPPPLHPPLISPLKIESPAFYIKCVYSGSLRLGNVQLFITQNIPKMSYAQWAQNQGTREAKDTDSGSRIEEYQWGAHLYKKGLTTPSTLLRINKKKPYKVTIKYVFLHSPKSKLSI